jgi:hypothetical protein
MMTQYPEEKIPGGTVFHVLSPQDPGGSFFVRCDKHNKYIAVRHNYFEVGYATKGTLFDLAVEALGTCETCVAERNAQVTASKTCPQEEHDACGCLQ